MATNALPALAAATLALSVTGCGVDRTSAQNREPPRPFESAEAATPKPASFALTATGLTAVQAVAGRGTATTLSFGDAQANVVGALTELLGRPKPSENRECGAGPMQFADFGPITANFQEGRFVGWTADGGEGFETTDGVAPGARFADLARDHAARLMTGSTLDGEFAMAEAEGQSMGGFVDEAGRVTSLHGGTTCFFR